MAGGPYGKKSDIKFITWNDAKLHPEQKQVKESLRTRKMDEAYRRKARLEELREKNKHDPWKQKWYENESIKPFITDSLLSGDPSTIRLNNGSISVLQAADLYINHQINRPKGWTTERSQNTYSNCIRTYVSILGPTRLTSSITEKDLYRVLHRTHPKTKQPLSDETINSDRTKLIGMLNYWKEQGWITQVPKIEAVSPQDKIPVFIYEEEFLRVCWHKLQEVEKQTEASKRQEGYNRSLFVLAWMLLVGTGMRPDEAVHVELDDIHGHQIIVNAHTRGKTNSQRFVPALYEAENALSVLMDPAFRERDPALRKSKRLLAIETESTKHKISREFRSTWEKVFPEKHKRTAYHLRDTFAVRFLSDDRQGNYDYRLLQLRNILGHRLITTTEKYLKAVPNRLDLSLPDSADLLNVLGMK